MQDNGGEHDPAQVDDAAGREMPSAQPTPAQSPGSPEGPARPAESPERPPESAADKAAQAPQPQTQTQTQTQAQPQTRCSRRRRLALGIGAAGTAAVVAFAAFAAVGGLSGPAQASSAIPSPPRQNKTFVEDDDGTGADSQANILQSAAPGLVHVVTPDGTPAGTGVILTPSGLVLT